MTQPPLTANEKDVLIKKNGIGYVLTWGDEERRVTPGEALGLFTSLLHTLPDIPEGIRTAEHITRGPRVTIRRLWTCHHNTIKQDRFQAFIHVAGILVHRCNPCPTAEDALALAVLDYDRPLEIHKVEDAPGSRQVAEKAALEWIIQDYVSQRGITVPELFKAVNLSGMPVDLNLEVTVSV